MLLSDVHRAFRKTGNNINITKFQKVEFVCDSVMHIPYIIFEIIFHYMFLQDIAYGPLCSTANLCCLFYIFFF